MHISREMPKQMRERLLHVIASVELEIFGGTYAFEEGVPARVVRQTRL